jgi:hypothetical protein
MIAEVVSPVAGEGQALPVCVPPAPQKYSLSQRLRSGYHAIWYRLGEGLCWSRGVYHERPVGQLDHLSGCQHTRIAVLSRRFAVRFEQQAEHLTALKNYDYLGILEQAWSAWGRPRSVGGVVHDVGSSNFWYAPVLHAFFRPSELIGVEVEGHRIYYNGYSRWDYARGYVQDLPNTQFVIQDYTRFDEQADVVTAWYPFVTPAPVLAWRMPLSVLSPAAIFQRIAGNLKSNGLFVMVNQGVEEAAIAAMHCRQAGLELLTSCELRSTLRKRRVPPVVSCWGIASQT